MDGKQLVLNKKKDTDFDSEANVIVRNMPKELDQSKLHAIFNGFGTIISCKVEVNKDGSSRGFGYVQFSNKEDAAKSIASLNGTKQMDKEIQVLVHSKKVDREATGEHFTNLFVKNIPENMTEAELTDIFAEFGEITSVKVKGSGSDVGFVMFKDHESAAKAIEALNQKKQINGKVIFVSKHISKAENLSFQTVPPISQAMKETFKSNIYVRFIPKDVTEDEFREKMTKAGVITSLKLKDHEQVINGETFVGYKIGYVCYEAVGQAQKCIQMFDSTNVFGYKKTLKVDFWQSRFDLRHENEEKNIN